MPNDKDARDAIEENGKRDAAGKRPAAGPHAQEQLTDHEKTPGTGSLPDESNKEADVGPD